MLEAAGSCRGVGPLWLRLVRLKRVAAGPRDLLPGVLCGVRSARLHRESVPGGVAVIQRGGACVCVHAGRAGGV